MDIFKAHTQIVGDYATYIRSFLKISRVGFSTQNFSTITRIALNLLKNDKTKKRSIKGKRLDAAWNNNYLLQILQN
jgi:hypothetical protein